MDENPIFCVISHIVALACDDEAFRFPGITPRMIFTLGVRAGLNSQPIQWHDPRRPRELSAHQLQELRQDARIQEFRFDPPQSAKPGGNLERQIAVVDDMISLCTRQERRPRKPRQSWDDKMATSSSDDDMSGTNVKSECSDTDTSITDQVPLQCLYCLGDTTLPLSEQQHVFGSKYSLQRHFDITSFGSFSSVRPHNVYCNLLHFDSGALHEYTSLFVSQRRSPCSADVYGPEIHVEEHTSSRESDCNDDDWSTDNDSEMSLDDPGLDLDFGEYDSDWFHMRRRLWKLLGNKIDDCPEVIAGTNHMWQTNFEIETFDWPIILMQAFLDPRTHPRAEVAEVLDLTTFSA